MSLSSTPATDAKSQRGCQAPRNWRSVLIRRFLPPNLCTLALPSSRFFLSSAHSRRRRTYALPPRESRPRFSFSIMAAENAAAANIVDSFSESWSSGTTVSGVICLVLLSSLSPTLPAIHLPCFHISDLYSSRPVGSVTSPSCPILMVP
jgi:hypothetical protein